MKCKEWAPGMLGVDFSTTCTNLQGRNRNQVFAALEEAEVSEPYIGLKLERELKLETDFDL